MSGKKLRPVSRVISFSVGAFWYFSIFILIVVIGVMFLSLLGFGP